ncbi:hypothetical protein BDN72DRAFT_890635 [Pluteus cervinus]|uniref:Uncharacterized protein n=1 Tax=Pluteus cervinus TaxID=181527 RepID=A0ACD3BGN1_9AGAR|nr:hypothetical protein BDN72DRAFT_890635 [Pluteus cervinus]
MAALPDISSISLTDSHPNGILTNGDEEHDSDEPYILKWHAYAKSLPYPIESPKKMLEMLDFILLRLTQCLEARNYDVGLLQWDSMITYWSMLKYPIPKDKRIKLAKIFFHVTTTPGMSTQIVATCSDAFKTLTRSTNKLSIKDMRLPWRPIYDILSQDLFLTRRQFEYTQLSWCMGYMADNARRFFHPAAAAEMLDTFVPLIDGIRLDSLLSTQFHLLTFLPLSHPQSYLPMLFRIWESVNSYMYDERMLHFLAKLAEMHVDPDVSNPKHVSELPDDEISPGEGRPTWLQDALSSHGLWDGIFKDVEIPLADGGGSLTTGPSADSQVGFEIGRLPKPAWRIPSLARIIVYSMMTDSLATPESSMPTPMFTPSVSGVSTPQLQTKPLGDYLSAPISSGPLPKRKGYLAGSRALDSLAKLIASTESFFHPSNSGAWTADLSAFIKYIVYDFNKRWYEEQKPDCKTPMHRRLTSQMRRELVKSLRTVAFLAMFSQDSTTVVNIQSCLKSMSVMEPDLILYPILERAVPSLEALVETQRTIAVIKALGAVAPAIVSRDIHYPGAKHLVPLLQLLIPGIDLNDPSKTLCTTAFLVEISQYIKFGDLTENEQYRSVHLDSTLPSQPEGIPTIATDMVDPSAVFDQTLSKDAEDALLKDTTGSFPDWITSFIRRVIQLLENLPEEGPGGTAGGASEVQVVDAVTGACSQICVHLSEPLYDLVLNMVYDYASNNVRSNAVRAIHQLVECVANANPIKTLEKFLPFCSRNIRVELENGASSLRTTSSSSPIPSDATLHWNLAILRGTVYNDGRAVLKHKTELTDLLRLLRDKTLSKRGYSWSGKLLSSMLLTLTHTYPLENKFVNPAEWKSEGESVWLRSHFSSNFASEFSFNHHQHWGKLYERDAVEISWHVPSKDEIDFALEVFQVLIEPTLALLENLLEPGIVRDATWRNDFCRSSYLSFVRNAFGGVPTLMKEVMTPKQVASMAETSDILHDIPEMIASIEPIVSGFCLNDPKDPRYQYMKGLKHRFGTFLHDASVSLRQQGEENTVDAVDMLVRAVRTYFLEYGDSRDSYVLNDEQYSREKNVARQYAGQKDWPRAVLIRRARFYHSARLRWNSIERYRGPLEDSLIGDIAEWCMWHYAVIRQSSQSLLESICGLFDGVRRRAFPVLYSGLEPGAEDDRMKGALWTINSPSFGKYAVSEPTLLPELVESLFNCQHKEKPSIQDCVAVVAENCLSSFVEPSHLMYDIPAPCLDGAIEVMKSTLNIPTGSKQLIERCRQQRLKRKDLSDQAVKRATISILEIAKSSQTHWRYAIFAVRCLRTLVRRDSPLNAEHVCFFLDKIHDDHPTIRYYAQRAVMKSMRILKLRTYCKTIEDLALGNSTNPLKRKIPVQASQHSRDKILQNYHQPIDYNSPGDHQLLLDGNPPGWLTCNSEFTLYALPDETKPTFGPWEAASQEAVDAIREMVTDPEFWEELSGHFSEENHEEVITQDNVSCVKSIFQVLEDEPFEALKPTLEGLIADKDQNKQRAAAELLAGLLNGSKHWPLEKQQRIWEWFKPYLSVIFKQNIKSDTLFVWTSFLEYIFYRKDPRRLGPLVDHLVEALQSLDFNGEMAFDAVKVLSLFRAFYEELGPKFTPWVNDILARCWPELHSEHDDVRAYVGEILAFTENIMWRPQPTAPSTATFMKECRLLPLDFDIMGMHGTFHKQRVQELVEKFHVWREERIPGVRAFQSTYDRVGITICKWLFQAVHDIHAISTFDYILPLLPELFRFTEVNDNDELASRASILLVRMCGVTPPVSLINPILDSIFEAIQTSPSWKVRLKALPLVQASTPQVFYFRQVPLLLDNDNQINRMLEVLCQCLDDEVVEVREMAATTLTGILRLSPRRSVLSLKDRFVRLARNSHIPDRQNPDYNRAIRQRHAAILGICALVDSYPYTVEKWMPELLTNVLAEHTYDPLPISTTIHNDSMKISWHPFLPYLLDHPIMPDEIRSAVVKMILWSNATLCRGKIQYIANSKTRD